MTMGVLDGIKVLEMARVPPAEMPAVATPRACPRRRTNQRATTALLGRWPMQVEPKATS